MDKKPEGNVIFLFTDIEGSTKLAQKDTDNYTLALEKHNEILSEIIQSNNGFVFKTVGDAFCCAFGNASDAIKAAVESQIMLASEDWREMVIKVRMGIHSGTAEWNGRDYVGQLTLARAEKVMSTADGGQILISKDAYEKITASEFDELLSSANGEISFMDLGERRLKDLIQPVRIYQITAAGLRSEFPQLNTLDVRPNNLPVQISNFIGREQDIKFIRENLELCKEAAKNKNRVVDWDALLALDEKRRELIGKSEVVRAKRNTVKGDGKDPAVREEGKKLKEELKTIEDELRIVEEKECVKCNCK